MMMTMTRSVRCAAVVLAAVGRRADADKQEATAQPPDHHHRAGELDGDGTRCWCWCCWAPAHGRGAGLGRQRFGHHGAVGGRRVERPQRSGDGALGAQRADGMRRGVGQELAGQRRQEGGVDLGAEVRAQERGETLGQEQGRRGRRERHGRFCFRCTDSVESCCSLLRLSGLSVRTARFPSRSYG
ncbi:hypothetical protein GGR56DRAFT_638292 [Xylariaceae sp. FL0804]|nr:hypothetical protein GGR56DRAFT_638292 [Xylariaceae sp. FL0804]